MHRKMVRWTVLVGLAACGEVTPTLVSVDGPGSSRETELGPTTKSLATGRGVAFSVTANP